MTHLFILKFGKYKGQNFNSTPVSYQSWLLNQDWFKVPTSSVEKLYANAAHNMVRSNYSEKSINAMFDAEVMLDDAMYSANKYIGMNAEQKQSDMKHECDEINACNMSYDYYNN